MILTIANQKGGVAKTTTAFHLAIALSKIGKKVCLVDFDSQANLTLMIDQLPDELSSKGLTIAKALVGPSEEIKDIRELIIPGDIDFIPTSLDLADVPQALSSNLDRNHALSDALNPIVKLYDYIIIDTAPTLEILLVNALAACNSVLIPVKTDSLSLVGISRLLSTISKIKKRVNPAIQIAGILPTIFVPRQIEDETALSDLREQAGQAGIKVFDPVHRSTAFSKAFSERTNVIDSYPRTPGIKVYNDIAIDLENKHG